MNARFSISGKGCGVRVSRCSLNTTNSSLPGWYSHRSRTLVLSALLLELYWMSALTNMVGVKVYVARVVTSWVVKLPWDNSTRLIDSPWYASSPSSC